MIMSTILRNQKFHVDASLVTQIQNGAATINKSTLTANEDVPVRT